MINTFKFYAYLSGFILLTGCAQTPGLNPGERSPKLVMTDSIVHWDHVSSFGAVPKDMAERASKACENLSTTELVWTATGYHPKGINLKGVPFSDGSFYCESKKR